MKTATLFLCLVQVYATTLRTSNHGFSTRPGWPDLTMITPAEEMLRLTPDDDHSMASVQFMYVIGGSFSLDFRYQTCDRSPLENANTAGNGVSVILGKPLDTYIFSRTLPAGNALGVINDGHGFAFLLKTNGKSVSLIDGYGKTLISVADYPLDTRCNSLPVTISLDEDSRLLSIRARAPHRATPKITLTAVSSAEFSGDGLSFSYKLSEREYQSLTGAHLAFGAATGVCSDGAHNIYVVRNVGLARMD